MCKCCSDGFKAVAAAGVVLRGYEALKAASYSPDALAVLSYGDIPGDNGAGMFMFEATSSADEALPFVVRPSNIPSFSLGRWVRIL